MLLTYLQKNLYRRSFKAQELVLQFHDLGRLTHDLYQLLSYYYVHMINIINNIFSEVAIYKKTLHKTLHNCLLLCYTDLGKSSIQYAVLLRTTHNLAYLTIKYCCCCWLH